MRLLVAVLFLALLACAAGSRPAEGGYEKLTAFFKKYLDREFASRPYEATRLG
jgi:hypothetical protein